jgi:hypothetical protein
MSRVNSLLNISVISDLTEKITILVNIIVIKSNFLTRHRLEDALKKKEEKENVGRRKIHCLSVLSLNSLRISVSLF